MKVVFRVDASPAIGTGHVMRCMSLADALAVRGADIVFVTRAFARGGADMLAARGHRSRRLAVEPGCEETWLGASQATEQRESHEVFRNIGEIDWLVVDQYALGVSWERAARPFTKRILVIDDLADREHDCDALLDTTYLPPGTPDRYTKWLPVDAVKLYGPRYSLLRPQFAAQSRRVRDRFSHVLVFFGGGDPFDVTSRAIDAFEDRRLHDISLDVVIGSANAWRAAIEGRASRRVQVHVDTSDMAELMAAADCALGAGGTASWERAWVGLPALVVTIADNQRLITSGLAGAGAIRDLGWHADVTAEHIASALVALRDRLDDLAEMSRASLAIMGQGPLGTELVADVLFGAFAKGSV